MKTFQETVATHRREAADLVADSGDRVARMKEREREERRKLAAVKVLPPGERPRCENCGRELRLYRGRASEYARERLYGDYGDGAFCGLRCGYHFALRVLRERWRKV